MAYTTIDDPSAFFQAALYTGNASSNKAITNDGNSDLQPDWVWIKERSSTSSHFLNDSVRGAGENIYSNNTSADGTNTALFTSFNSDGFTVGNTNQGNQNNETYVAWQWKAGTSFSNDASSTSVGSIDSAGSINTDAGFAIISYTGTGEVGTIAHGLGTTPELVILRNREVTSNWWVWGGFLGSNQIMELDTSAAKYNPNGNYHNDTMPTSSVISIGSDGQVSGNGQSHICYAFHSVQGYSKIGSFVSNNTTDNTFVYCGFKPALVLLKSTTSTNDWMIFDYKRDPGNVTQHKLYPNITSAEATTENDIDLLSNGFKLRNAHGANTFIFMAFAEQPFVTSTGVPATAR